VAAAETDKASEIEQLVTVTVDIVVAIAEIDEVTALLAGEPLLAAGGGVLHGKLHEVGVRVRGRENKTTLFHCQCSVGLCCSLKSYFILLYQGFRNMRDNRFSSFLVLSSLIELSIIRGTSYL